MFQSFLVLLAVCGSTVYSVCVDGIHNVIQIYDTSNRNAKILVKHVEIGTYDRNKKPICVDGKPQVTFPGYFKLLNGTVEVLENVDGLQPFHFSITLEKNSFFVGVVCEKGKSKNSFVPDEMCIFDLCDIFPECRRLRFQTTTPIDIVSLVNKEYIYMGAMSSPYISGEWQISMELIQGQNVLGGLRVGKRSEWLTVENMESEAGKDEHQDL